MKGGIAAMLAVLKALSDANLKLNGDLVFSSVADEEYASIGTEALVKEYKTDAAIVTEPTDLDVCLVHRGFYVFNIETEGRAAHGSKYSEGIDANMYMGRIIAKLETLSKKLLKSKPHQLLGPPSLHIPLIKGGSELFIYSDKCEISVERRTLPGESHQKIVKEIADILSSLSHQDANFKAKFKTEIVR